MLGVAFTRNGEGFSLDARLLYILLSLGTAHPALLESQELNASPGDMNERKKIAIASAPWPLFNRPSIQLGTLKAYLKRQFPDLAVESHHLYLKVAADIGYDVYRAVSKHVWLSEAVYAALLFPGRREAIESRFQRASSRSPVLGKTGFPAMTAAVEKATSACIREIDWGSFSLAGFSVCLCQLTASLYFIRCIKADHPDLPVVVGGSQFSRETSGDFLQWFPEVDFMVSGEGELPLARLVEDLQNAPSPGSFFQLKDLTRLPPPDFDDYFALLQGLSPEKRFFPELPAEISRGCRYHRVPQSEGKPTGCAFCNLNLQWEGYREKSAGQVISEIDRLASRHRVLSIAFMDNLLPAASGEIFHGLRGLGKDLHLFGEIRASTPRHALETMKSAGFRQVQIGIESLSTSLLGKMNKGTTAIQNLEAMKNCEELGIGNLANLLVDFPGSDDRDVEETLRTLEFAIPFRPLKVVSFRLVLGSAVWRSPEKFGIRSVFTFPDYRILFPAEIAETAPFLVRGYRGDLKRQRRIWKPVKEKVRRWNRIYAKLRGQPDNPAVLSFLDGKDFLIIRQLRLGREPENHRLTGASRGIYLFCRHRRSVSRILKEFPGMTEDRLLPFLRTMVEKRLMFEENGVYLSLAIRQRVAL